MVMGQFSDWSSSSKHVGKAGLDGVSTSKDCRRQKKRGMHLKTPQRVGSQRNDFGNDHGDTDLEVFEIEKIDETEFYNTKTLVTSKIGLSTRQELNGGSSGASSWKNVENVTKKHPADLYGYFSPESVSHGSNQGFLFQKGKKTGNMICKEIQVENTDRVEFSTKKNYLKSEIGETAKQGVNGHFSATSNKNVGGVSKNKRGSFSPNDADSHSNKGSQDKSSAIGEKSTDFKSIGIERIGKAEFMKHKICSMSKIGISTREEVNEGYSAATSRKNLGNASKKTFSADCCGLFTSKDAFHGSGRASPHKLSIPVRDFCVGSDSEDIVSDEIEMEEISEAEFRNNQKAHSMSKIRPSSGQELTKDQSVASFGKNVNGASKNISSAGKNVDGANKIISSADHCVYKLKPLVKEVNSNKCMGYKDIKIVGTDEAKFKNEISRVASKIGSSSRRGLNERYSTANSLKNADVVKEVFFDSSCGSFSSGDDGRDSDKGQTNESSSFEETGNDDENTDLEDIGIEKITESEFRNKTSHFVSKIGSSRAATSAEKVINLSKKIPSTRKNDKDKKKRKVSAYSSRKRKDEYWNRNLNDDVNNSLIHYISSYSSFQSDNDISTDDGISSYGATHEINLGIAHRTRSKMRIIKKASEVKNVPLDLSDDSDSLSTDSGSDDEDFEVDRTCVDDIKYNYSNVEACDAQNNTSIEVSSKKSKDCNKQDGTAVKHASNIKTISKLPNKELNLRKRQLNHNESSKQTKEGKKHKTYEVREENEVMIKIPSDDANAEERNNGKKDNWVKSTYSKHLCSQKNCNEAEGVNGLHLKGQSQACIRRQKKAVSPSHSKYDCDDSDDDDDDDDDILEKLDVSSSDIHGDGKNEKYDVTDEIKPRKSKQVSSGHYDFCRMLADSVLGRGSMPETRGSDEEAKKAPASQTHNTLKFRFEDEVPKEVEKTEHGKEIEGLFAELDFCWALQELGSFKYPEVDQEIGDSPAEETPYARCTSGKHELVWIDDQGLICIYCRHVELGPKDVLPEWDEQICRESERKRLFETEQPLEFDELHLKFSIDNFADSRNIANGTVWSLKPGIRESMYEHQQEGFEFLWKNLAGSINLDELKSTNSGQVGGCIISHAPGTGKTRLTIVFIETYMKLFPDCRPLIIAPASMLLTWEEEFRKWNVGFPFLNLNNMEISVKENKTARGLLAGVKRRNMKTIRMVNLYSWNNGRSILGISYSLFEKLTGKKYLKEASNKSKIDSGTKDLRKILLEKPGLVVLDEGHTPRNQRSNIWNVLLKLQTEKRVILSGTPFQNNFAELFNTLRIVRPAIADALVQEKTFAEMITSRRKYKGENSQSNLISEIDGRAVEKLKIYMSPFVHVHKGTILQQSLPGLRDCVVLLKPPALQKSLIERLEGTPSTFQFEHKAALLSVHPYLFQHSDSTEEERIGIDLAAIEASKLNPNEGVKTKFILEFVRLSMAMNEKVLIFSQYIQPLELIKEQLKEIFKWVEGKQILQMQGKLDQKQRQILINVFNDAQSESKIMLASTRCCSEGISLVGASRVILLDVVWNPSVERQAISRAYRIGQKKFVHTYHLMTSGTTEADKYCRQAEKERLSELVFASSSNESSKQKLPCSGIEDRILEVMVDHANLKEMFEKIINQPKDANLIQTFGLTS